MMKNLNIIILIGIYISCVGISSCRGNLIDTISGKAGSNTEELLKVLEYYKDDKLKLQAAQFLIENMDVHYSYKNAAIDTFYKDIDSLFTQHPWRNDGFYNDAYDFLLDKKDSTEAEAIKHWDIENITSEYLIAHIDSAFKVWNQPWNGKYNFNHFCNYVLPYRIGAEPLSEWRVVFMKQYLPEVQKVRNSQLNHHYKYGAYATINQGFHTAVYYPKQDFPELPLSVLPKVRVGNCDSYASRNVAQMRAIGLPAAKDFTPQWGNRSMGHSWAVLLPDEKHSFPFGPNEHLGAHMFWRPEHTMPKVFRNTFKKQEEMYDIVNSDEPVPELFQNLCIKNVTSEYIKTSDINITLFNHPIVNNHKWIYLTVFNNQDWSIVHYGKRRGRKVHFKQMGRKIVYLPVCYIGNGQTFPAGYPFILNNDGSIQVLRADTTYRKQVRLVRKYKFSNALETYCRRTWGGKFQVANQEDFSDSLTIAVIDSIQENRFHTIPTHYKGNYRYFRYLSPKGSHGNMAEVEMYDSINSRPVIKQMFGMRYATPNCNLEKMFDGDVLTCYNRNAADEGWAAVEFEQPVHLCEIRFLPRNDDNFIREGEHYRLYYWSEEGWSLIKELTGNREGVLFVDNVPDTALLLLRNISKGKEERIFTYTDGKQIWW